jgi:hypothetical protein
LGFQKLLLCCAGPLLRFLEVLLNLLHLPVLGSYLRLGRGQGLLLLFQVLVGLLQLVLVEDKIFLNLGELLLELTDFLVYLGTFSGSVIETRIFLCTLSLHGIKKVTARCLSLCMHRSLKSSYGFDAVF